MTQSVTTTARGKVLVSMIWVVLALSGSVSAEVTVYPAPEGSPVSRDYTVTVEGKSVDVYGVPTRYGKPACFGYFDIDGPVTVEVRVNFPPDAKNISVHPRSLGIAVQREKDCFRLKVAGPGSVTLVVNGDHETRPLHLFVNPPAEKPPTGAIDFAPGMHRPGYGKPITLKDGQTLHIAGGAWVEDGIIRATGARNIRIMGRGVLSQKSLADKDYKGNQRGPVGIFLKDCQDVTLSGIIETRSVSSWCSEAVNCDRVRVEDYHVIAPVVPSTDGFNPGNSRDVTITRSFFRTGDDCIAIKGKKGPPEGRPADQPPVENIAVSNCVFWSDNNQVVAIGCETCAKHIHNVRIADSDVIYNRGLPDMQLGVFGIVPIHGTDIRDIVFQNLRVEHVKHNLFCFRFFERIFDIEGDLRHPGNIANVTIRNVRLYGEAGEPPNEFKGFDDQHKIRNISIQGLFYGPKPIRDAGAMKLSRNRHVAGVQFEGGAALPSPVVSDVVYLSGVRPTNLRVPQEGNPFGQGRTTVGGVDDEHGVFLHPPTNGSSAATFDVPRDFRSFVGSVGMSDTATAQKTAVIFKIVDDRNKLLWQSKPIAGRGLLEAFKVSVDKTSSVTLVVECPGDHSFAHAVWVAPRFAQ